MTILEKLEKRKQAADANLNAFRGSCDYLDVYRRVCEQIVIWSYLRALSQAPLTMNPKKIQKHFSYVKDFLLEISINENEKQSVEAASNAFLEELLSTDIQDINVYSRKLSIWITKNVPESIKNEAINLTNKVN